MGGGPVAATATGAEIFQAKCRCHGPDGKGGRAPALTGGAGKSEDELFKIIHDGKGKMPAFASQLSDDQIKKVASAVKGFQ
jgi:mono/diheme cytochrome c family protein